MKFAASTLALPAFDHLDLLPRLRPLGLSGLEVIPSRVWADTGEGLTARAVATYRYAALEAGLEIVGLDGLLADRPGLGLFKGPEAAAATADFLVHLSAICRDLGGRTLIWGGERHRNGMPPLQAWAECRALLEAVLPRIEAHGTVLCLAPRSKANADFCNAARECLMLVNHMDHPAFGLHLSSEVQAANGESGHASFSAVRDRLEHFHVDEPGQAVLGTSGAIDHADCRRHLASISYRKWVVMKQRETADPLDGLSLAAGILTTTYLREDNLALRQRRKDLASRKYAHREGIAP